MSVKNEKAIAVFFTLGLALAIVVSLAGLVQDFKNTREFGGVDLRVRVTAARLLTSGRDPYFYKWRGGDSPLLLTPSDNPNFPTNQISETPAFLSLLAPVSWLSYGFLRNSWLALQWLLLLLAMSLFIGAAKSSLKIKAILIVGLLFIGGSGGWRLHIERGQFKILYVFLIALAFWMARRKFKAADFAAGAVSGFSAALRPPGLLMLVPMAVFKKWKFLVGACAGLAVGILSPVFFSGLSIWERYFAAMRIQSLVYLDLSRFPPGEYPKFEIEGMNNLTKMLANPLPQSDCSVGGVLHNYWGFPVSPRLLFAGLIPVLLILAGILLRFRKREVDYSQLFLIGSGLVFLSEFFLPAPRYSYYNVIWLIPMCLVIFRSKSTASLVIPIIVLTVNAVVAVLFPARGIGWIAGNYIVLIYALGAAINSLCTWVPHARQSSDGMAETRDS